MIAVTALDLLTLVIAIVGALTGVIALVWQAVTFVLTGGRARVDLKVAWLGPGGAVVGEPGSWALGRSPAPGYDSECLGVEVSNVGRLPISVTGWGVTVGAGQLGFVQSPWNKPLPHRLDVGEAATWFVAVSEVLGASKLLKASAVPVTAVATLGTGKRVVSKSSLTLP